jgi:hypothetical protein
MPGAEAGLQQRGIGLWAKPALGMFEELAGI